MQRRPYWLMSDPAANAQFRRPWEDRPPPQKPHSRTRRPVAGGGAGIGGFVREQRDSITDLRSAQQAAAEALFERAAV
jgi:hypothetical protein